MVRMSGRTVRILEFAAAPAGKPLKIDRDRAIVFGVKVLGEKSLNSPPHDNDYPRSTREAARAVLEGQHSYVSHAGKNQERSYAEQIGRHRNVREEGDGLYSDFYYNPKHPLAEQFLWDAEHSCDSVCFSINATGRGTTGPDGRQVIEAITEAFSIDLVCRGGTTRGLNESQHTKRGRTMPQTTGKKTRRQVLAEHIHAPALKKWLLETYGEDGMMPMDEPAEEEGGGKGPMPDEPPDHTEICGQIKAMAEEALSGTDEKVHSPKYRAFLQKVMDLCDKFDGGEGGGEPDEPDEPETVPTEESRKLKADHARLLRESQVRVLCDAAQFVPSAVQMKALAPLADDEARTLIESFKGGQQHQQTPPGQRPRSLGRHNDDGPAPGRGDGGNGKSGGKPLQESQKSGDEKTTEELVALFRGAGR